MNKWEYLEDDFEDEKPFERIERRKDREAEIAAPRKTDKKDRKKARELKEFKPVIEEDADD